MPEDLPHHIVYWNGTTYKSATKLAVQLAANADHICRNGVQVGAVGVYFTDRPALDLEPAVRAVMLRHADAMPVSRRWGLTEAQKNELKTWRTAVRADLRTALDPLVPAEIKD